MTNDELFMCKNAIAGEDSDGLTIPWCQLCEMSCDSVLRFDDDSCKYEKMEDQDDFDWMERDGDEE